MLSNHGEYDGVYAARRAVAPSRLHACLLALCVAVPVLVAQAPVPRYEVRRVVAPIAIDGRLNEGAWAAAPAVTLQFLWDSQTGAKQATRARLLWGADGL